MTRTLLLLLFCLASASCVSTYYRNGGNGYLVRSSEKGRGGQVGALHPAVIEYVFASEEGPYRDYYAAALAQGLESGDISELRALASAGLAEGATLSGELMARARARSLAESIQKGFENPEHMPGAVEIFSMGRVDRDTGIADQGNVFTLLMVNRKAQVVRLEWSDGRTNRVLSWDLSSLKGSAFASTGTLSYEEVARSVRPLHPPQRRHY